MIPVLGIGAAYQPSHQHASAPHRTFAPTTFSWQQQRDGAFGFTFSDAAPRAGGGGAAAGPMSGGGVLMWQTATGALAMAGLPAPPGGVVQYAAGDDSDDPDGEEGGVPVLQAPSMGEVGLV